MVAEEDYWGAIEELIEFCKGSQHRGDIMAIYLGGSVARGDFSPGRSDIDIYVIVSRKKEEIEEELKEAARGIVIERLKGLLEVHQEPLGITVTTVSEIRAGSSFLAAGFEYHNFMKTGKLLWGREIKTLIPKPSREEERVSAKQALEEICALLTERKLQGDEQHRERLTYHLFSAIFRTACIALCGEGRYVSGKGEAVLAFREVHPQEHELHDVLCQSLSLWKKWERRALTNEEFQQLRELCWKFVPRVCKLWSAMP